MGSSRSYFEGKTFNGDDVLGILLLCLGLGSLTIMPLAGTLASKFGCRKILTFVAALFAILLLIICQLSSLKAAILTLIIFGTTMGCLDVVMNIQTVIVEKASERRMMSGMHAITPSTKNPKNVVK